MRYKGVISLYTPTPHTAEERFSFGRDNTKERRGIEMDTLSG